MKKDYDFDDEVSDKVKILIKIIPVVLIIVILGVSLLVSSIKNKKEEADTEDLQESIMNYADSNLSDKGTDESAQTVEASEKPSAQATEAPKEVKKPVPTPQKEIMDSKKVDYSKVTFHKDEQLKEMMSYWADNNQKALDDLVHLERFLAMSWKLSGTKDFYYYGDTDGSGQPNGTGIAVYADNQYYYGEWSGGVRSGNGTWMHYHIHTTANKNDLYTYHQYTGFWKNDLPDGEGAEHYDYVIEMLKENVGYNNNLIGSYAKGLINGEFYLTNIYSDKNTKEWYAAAENGSWVYQNENKDSKGRRPVQVEDRDDENYIWMHPKDNVNIGVPCLISKNKN